MLNVIQGPIDRNKVAAFSAFRRELSSLPSVAGTLFIGFPIVEVAGETTAVDALLVSPTHGLVVIDVLADGQIELDALSGRHDDIYISLRNRFIKRESLRRNRDMLKFDLRLLTYAPFATGSEEAVSDSAELVVGMGHLGSFFEHGASLEDDLVREITAVLQAMDRLRPRNGRHRARPHTKGDTLAYISGQIANLDRFQNKAIIETTDSPQRIRGLAGCGKTVVIASKAAYLHASPASRDLRIAVTFYTRALHGHLRSLITRFYQAYTNSLDEPDFNRLRLLHAWGSESDPGIYSAIALANDRKVYDFAAARQTFGNKAFEGACEDLLRSLPDGPRRAVFDLVIIDEAQDLPRAFFELVYLSTSDPRRVVWAYDELQKLDSEETMPPPEALFGSQADGRPRVTLRNEEGRPDQDIVLPVCYRNPREILVTAHALGFGIYRSSSVPIQMLTDGDLWRDIGYHFVEGEPEPGSPVRLSRSPEASPDFLSEHAGKSAIVEAKVFQNYEAQAIWIANQIKKNIEQDDLQPSDILVIHPEPKTIKSACRLLQARLAEIGISSHLAGAGYDRDEFFVPGSIVLSHIFRAKGNEAAMVYVMDSHLCVSGHELIKKRNALFTAVTRARAWVRLCGVGDDMVSLRSEVGKVKQQNYTLAFVWPTPEALEKMRKLHRELTPEEKRTRDRGKKSAAELLDLITNGKLDLDELPQETLDSLRQVLAEK